MPQVIYSRAAQRDLERLDTAIVRRIDQSIEALARGEVRGKLLRHGFAHVFCLRVGDWRVLYRPLVPDRLEIVAIGHRREAYRRR